MPKLERSVAICRRIGRIPGLRMWVDPGHAAGHNAHLDYPYVRDIARFTAAKGSPCATRSITQARSEGHDDSFGK